MKVLSWGMPLGSTMAGLTIEATESEYYGTYGRKAGKRPPVYPIFKWVEKNETLFDAATRNEQMSVAFAIARKIGNEGTKTTPNAQRVKDYEDTVEKAVYDTIGVEVEYQLINSLT
jgi:phosphoribosylformimino-5-aminoimidazole carboxamide ribonucleotide (ProFAR) isomerase